MTYQTGFKPGNCYINQFLSITHIYKSVDYGFDVKNVFRNFS